MKRLRHFAVLALAVLAFALPSCSNRSFTEDMSQKGQVLQRDSAEVYDLISKYMFNHDPDDPYLD